MKNSDIAEYVQVNIHNELHRRILLRRWVDGITYESLAEEFNYSTRQIKRIVKKYVT